MSWRIHLANQAIRNLYILPGKNPVVAAETRADRFELFDLEMGDNLDARNLNIAPNAPYESEAWQEYMLSLSGYGNVFLPFIRNATRDIYITDDGKLRLYHEDNAKLTLDVNGVISELSVKDVQRLMLLKLDGQLGTIATVDEKGLLHLYQQDLLLGRFDIGLSLSAERRSALAISKGGQSLYVSDGQKVVSVSGTGTVRKTLELHYEMGMMACSPSGATLLISDRESGVLRVYRTEDMALTHQKFAIELVASAAQVQLIADLPPINTAISALSVYTQGMIVFAMSGVVCMTDVTFMDELPRAKTLL
jgi:hypothetical protein